MSRIIKITTKATTGVINCLVLLTAIYLVHWRSIWPAEANAYYVQRAPKQPQILTDSARKSNGSPLLNVVVRLIDAEADTAIANAKLLVIDEKNGQSLPFLPDSLGFKLSALPGTTLMIQASAPTHLAAKTRIINLAISQQVIMKLTPKKPSVLTIKAFAMKIDKPLSPATAMITSRTTGKVEKFEMINGRLERRFAQPDNVDIEVSSPGYTSVSRQLNIDVPSSGSGNRYEFDAELDKILISITVRAVNSQTNEAVAGGHFTLTGPAETAPLALMPTAENGLSTTSLPDKGTYQLVGTAEGYENVSQSVVIEKEKTEVLVKLVGTELMESKSLIAVASVKPTLFKMNTASVSDLPKGGVTTKTFGVIEKGKSIQLNKLYFDQSSPVLRPESYTELDQLYGVLTQYPSLRIEIHGHTDNQGDFDLNTKLSRDRCQAVIDYLVGKGIRKNRLKAVGRGPLDPVAPNNNEENRKKNRRVEFVLY